MEKHGDMGGFPTTRIGQQEAVLLANMATTDEEREASVRDMEESALRMAAIKILSHRRTRSFDVWALPLIFSALLVGFYLWATGVFTAKIDPPNVVGVIFFGGTCLALVQRAIQKTLAVTVEYTNAYRNIKPEDIFGVVGVEKLNSGRIKVTIKGRDQELYRAEVSNPPKVEFPQNDRENIPKLTEYVVGRLYYKWKSSLETMNFEP